MSHLAHMREEALRTAQALLILKRQLAQPATGSLDGLTIMNSIVWSALADVRTDVTWPVPEIGHTREEVLSLVFLRAAHQLKRDLLAAESHAWSAERQYEDIVRPALENLTADGALIPVIITGCRKAQQTLKSS